MQLLKVDRSSPCDLSFLGDSKFSPGSILNSPYSFWREPNDLEGGRIIKPEEHDDQRSLALTDVEIFKLKFARSHMTLREKGLGIIRLMRFIRRTSYIRLDIAFGKILWEEPEHETLEWLRNHYEVTEFDLLGTVLRQDYGGHYALMFSHVNGKWTKFVYQLGLDIAFDIPSLVIYPNWSD